MRRYLGQTGDTLVEVSMALALLAVTLVTSFTIANASYAQGMQAREHTQAIYLVQEQAERLQLLRDIRTADPTLAASSPLFDGTYFGCGGTCHMEAVGNAVTLASGDQLTSPFAGVQYKVSIKPVPGYSFLYVDNNGDANSLLKARITVTWDSPVSTTVAGNTTSIDLILADKRNIIPRDCSIAGNPLCN